MTTGISSKSVDLDNIFDPYVTGTSPGLTGYKTAGTDINTRYAPLVYGTAAPATGLLCKVGGAGSFVDLNTLFAAKGTASYATPDNGVTYNANYVVPNPGSGSAGLIMELSSLSPLQYTVTHSGTGTTPAPATYNVPSGMAYVKATLTYVSGTAAATIVQTTSWTALSTLGQTIAQMVSAVKAYGSGTTLGSYTCALQFSADGVNAVYTGSTTWNYKVDGSV